MTQNNKTAEMKQKERDEAEFEKLCDQIDDLDMFKGVNQMSLKKFAQYFYGAALHAERTRKSEVVGITGLMEELFGRDAFNPCYGYKPEDVLKGMLEAYAQGERAKEKEVEELKADRDGYKKEFEKYLASHGNAMIQLAELRSQLEACHRDGIKYAGMEKENFELRKDLAWATDYAERTGLFSTRGKAKAIRVKHFGEGKG